tara:strand:- start:57 stop:305 length:249 start_codon:yes stop_codon:yes gene_type:complete
MRVKHPNFLTLSELVCPHFLNMQTPTYHSTLDWGRIEKIVDELDQQFPDRFPDHNLSEKAISYRAGQLSIIRLLKNKLKHGE